MTMSTGQKMQSIAANTIIKAKVVEVIRQSPDGIRLRHIGTAVGEWHPYLRVLIDDLVEEKVITEEYKSDPANMEFYYVYKINQ